VWAKFTTSGVSLPDQEPGVQQLVIYGFSVAGLAEHWSIYLITGLPASICVQVITQDRSGHRDPLRGALYNSTFSVVVSADEGGTVCVWNIQVRAPGASTSFCLHPQLALSYRGCWRCRGHHCTAQEQCYLSPCLRCCNLRPCPVLCAHHANLG
jgi:hypothetical protein